jgi:predicted ester cyclase
MLGAHDLIEGMANSAAEEGGKALVRRSWEEIYSAGNLGGVEEVFDAQCVSHDPTFPGGVIEDANAIKGNIRRGQAAFENWRFEVEGLYEDGDHVISRVIMHGRHVGEFLGIPPSGADVTVSGITINRTKNGKIVERWGNWDTLGMLQQLGALPRVKNVG